MEVDGVHSEKGEVVLTPQRSVEHMSGRWSNRPLPLKQAPTDSERDLNSQCMLLVHFYAHAMRGG